jgi:hypothetical protein
MSENNKTIHLELDRWKNVKQEDTEDDRENEQNILSVFIKDNRFFNICKKIMADDEYKVFYILCKNHNTDIDDFIENNGTLRLKYLYFLSKVRLRFSYDFQEYYKIKINIINKFLHTEIDYTNLDLLFLSIEKKYKLLLNL